MADTLFPRRRSRFKERAFRMNSFIRKVSLLNRFGFFESRRSKNRVYRESSLARAAGPDG